MPPLPSKMPAEISRESWEFLGRVVKERREFIGLSQEDLARYGGPKKTTVSKIERAVETSYSPRTQQQLEKALGWERGAFRSILSAAESNWFNEKEAESVAVDFIESELPDLTVEDAAGEGGELSNADLVRLLAHRLGVVDPIDRRPEGRDGRGEPRDETVSLDTHQPVEVTDHLP